MREIKFRGKRIDIGRWVEGSYLKMFHGLHMDGNHYTHFIVDTKGIRYEVYPETIGQYTGLKDRYGQEIYEGDILRDDEMGLNVVRWEDGSFWLEMFYEGGQSLMEHLSDYNEVCEVIGNIYEHPHLLKGEGDA